MKKTFFTTMNRAQIIDKLNSDTFVKGENNVYGISVKKNNIIIVSLSRTHTKWKMEIKDKEISFVRQGSLFDWVYIAFLAFVDVFILCGLLQTVTTIKAMVVMAIFMLAFVGFQYLWMYSDGLFGLHFIKIFLKEYFDKDLK
jgi:maltodextrin utilization protein YvdJ